MSSTLLSGPGSMMDSSLQVKSEEPAKAGAALPEQGSMLVDYVADDETEQAAEGRQDGDAMGKIMRNSFSIDERTVQTMQKYATAIGAQTAEYASAIGERAPEYASAIGSLSAQGAELPAKLTKSIIDVSKKAFSKNLREVTCQLLLEEDDQRALEKLTEVTALILTTDENSRHWMAKKGHAAIFKMMRKHDKNAEIHAEGCRAIHNMLVHVDNNHVTVIHEDVHYLVGSGACTLVLDALRTFPQESRVQEWACGAIYCLAHGGKGIREQLLSMGILEEIVKTVHAFRDDEQVTKKARAAMNVLI